MGEISHIIACVWDFDKTLTPKYMQAPLFKDYGIDEPFFWKTVNGLPAKMRRDGVRLSGTLSYLNFVLELVKSGRLPGLSKAKLTQYGQSIEFFPGVPEIFPLLKSAVDSVELFKEYEISVEHYIISCGHVEIIRGSQVAPYMDAIYGCEYLEDEMTGAANDFCRAECTDPVAEEVHQEGKELHQEDNVQQMALTDYTGEPLVTADCKEVKRIGYVVDQAQKTRCLFEINKGCAKNGMLDVDAVMDDGERRIPFSNMIYIADGLSDVPAFSVVRRHGGKAFAVYNPENEAEFELCDRMLSSGRIDAYGAADYTSESVTTRWLKMHIQKIAKRIVGDELRAAENNAPPEILH